MIKKEIKGYIRQYQYFCQSHHKNKVAEKFSPMLLHEEQEIE